MHPLATATNFYGIDYSELPVHGGRTIINFMENWTLRLPSSSSVRVHPSRLVLSMPLYGLNCVLERMRVGRCEWGAAFLPSCLGPKFAASLLRGHT